MFDATKLLGELMANRAAPSAENRLNSVVSQGAADGGPFGSLGSLLGGLGGGGGGGGAGAPGGGLGGLLGQLVGGMQQAASTARTEVSSNNPAAVGGLGALAGAVLGGGRGALGGGLMAVLGSLAVSALQNAASQTGGQGGLPNSALGSNAAQNAAAPAGSPSYVPAAPSLPASPEAAQANARLLLQAMISAAKADGQIDGAEMNKIMGKLREAGSEPEAQQFVLQEMGKPLDLAGLAAAVPSPEMAVQVYAASLLAVEVDTPAERGYFAMLGQQLGLAPEVVEQIHRAMGVTV